MKDGLFERNDCPRNLIRLRSFSKAHGLSGLRVGYASLSDEMIRAYKDNTTRFEVSALSLLLASESVFDPAVTENIKATNQQRTFLQGELSHCGFDTTESQSACFMTTGQFGEPFFNKLQKQGISVVKIDGTDGKFHFRVAVQDKETNQKFVDAMQRI
jgi:histidinol-phosphate aminotransferase